MSFVAVSCFGQNAPGIKDLYGKSDVWQVVDPQLPGHDFIIPYGIRYMKASTTAPTCEVIDAKKVVVIDLVGPSPGEGDYSNCSELSSSVYSEVISGFRYFVFSYVAEETRKEFSQYRKVVLSTSNEIRECASDKLDEYMSSFKVSEKNVGEYLKRGLTKFGC